MLIVTPDLLAAVEQINSTLKGRQLIPATADDGTRFLNADILTDCDRGETWEAFRNILPKCELRVVPEIKTQRVVQGEVQEFCKVGAVLDVAESSKLKERFADVLAAQVLEPTGKL